MSLNPAGDELLDRHDEGIKFNAITDDVGADDVSSDDTNHEIITSVNEFNNVREKLENLLGIPEQAEIIWQPDNFVKVEEEKKLGTRRSNLIFI